MPSRSPTAPLLRAVLAGLWLASCRGTISDVERPACDNGKLHLQKDLPEDVYRDCAASAWPESAWKHPATNRIYDPEPARHVCMDKSIFYKHAIPNSGAYRPVMAESGEYVYCPPQRWLNNLHHAATVFLHHPCAPLHERMLLSILARSCLTHYILTSHPQLKQHTPVALVSWGRTLELSTVASPDVCDWLETTTSPRTTSAGASRSRTYDLLLTWSAQGLGQRRGEAPPTANTETARQCCEKIISSFLVEKEDLPSKVPRKRREKRREIRAALAAGWSDDSSESLTGNNSQTGEVPTPDTRTTGVSGSRISHTADELNRAGNPEAPSPSAGWNGSRSGEARTRATDTAEDPQKEGDLEDRQTRAKGDIRRGSSGPEEPSAFQIFPRSPRTDDAVWAAAALGSLLVVLALAVLHTRLYRHWRTTPSLYWYDPQQDYESVADVIRRRLRIAKRRSKRSRRQPCLLLPASSSSDEN